jgi:hypothetical protein
VVGDGWRPPQVVDWARCSKEGGGKGRKGVSKHKGREGRGFELGGGVVAVV